MTDRSKEITRVMLILWMMVLTAIACASNPTAGVTVSPATVTPIGTVTSSPPPTPTVTRSPTSTSTPFPSPTPTSTPTPTPDPAAICQVPGEDGRIFVIRDEKLQEQDVYMRSEVEKALREAVRRYYPGWAAYSQQLTFGKMVVTHDLVRTVIDAGLSCLEGPCPRKVSVNPLVILIVMTVRYGEEPPPGFDAHQTANQISLEVNRIYEKALSQPEVWQDRFASTGSYVMYEVLGQDERQLQRWCVAYHTIYTLTWQMMRP